MYLYHGIMLFVIVYWIQAYHYLCRCVGYNKGFLILECRVPVTSISSSLEMIPARKSIHSSSVITLP